MVSAPVMRFSTFRCLPLVLSLSGIAAEMPDPESLLPAAPAWHGASEALIVAPGDPLITPAERTGLTDTPNYADTIAYLELLETKSPFIKVIGFGETAHGRTLHYVIVSKEGCTSSEQLAKNKRPTMLAQAGIHSGEIDGKDAGLMLLRDIATGKKADLLDRANLIFIPVLNADGHERSSRYSRPNQRGPIHQGWRTTAQNLNLNRDYMKVDAPEMRMVLAVINDYQPDLYLDLHVTDGIDYPYDITYGYNGYGGQFAWSPKIAAWLGDVFSPDVDKALEAAGHKPGPLLFASNNRDLTEGLGMGVTPPRFSNGYGDLRHMATILVENHSLKPYRQRVLGTYVLLDASLRALAAHADRLRAAVAADSSAHPDKIAANWGMPSSKSVPWDFPGFAYEEYQSPASGTKEVRWLPVPKVYEKLPVHIDMNGATLLRPKFFYVPVTKPELIERLKLHGIELEVLEQDTTVAVSLARLDGPHADPEPFEGHYRLHPGELHWEQRMETYPAGSARISTVQPLGELVMMLLDPESDESFLAWGFFPEILQRTEYIEGYVLAPLAEKMLAVDPKLKAEFEAKLAGDKAFADNPTARLEWFYAHTPFYDDRYLLYPVGVVK